MPQIALPPDYCLRRVKHDYPDHRWALAREFVQNSVDAGAKRIDVTFADPGDGSCIITVADDGQGCDRETIENKLLVFGGSGKEAGGTVGGFGLAKELLYLAWPVWSIRTRDVLVSGSACSYDIAPAEPASGFTARIVVPASEDPWSRLSVGPPSSRFKAAFRCLVASCSLPGVVVTLDGEVASQDAATPRRALRDLGWCRLYRHQDHDAQIRIRAHGVTMFHDWSGHDEKLGRFVVELTGRSIDLLTAGRNAFKSNAHRRELTDFVASLRTEGKRALREQVVEDVILFCDDDGLKVLDELIRKQAGEVQPGDVRAIPGQPGTVAPQGAGFGGGQRIIGGHVPAMQDIRFGDRRAKAMIAALSAAGPNSALAGRPTLSRADVPDYGVSRFVLHTRGQIGRVKAFLQTPRAHQIARAWTAAIEAVLAAVGMVRDGTGFTFDDEVEAEALKTDQRSALLVHPRKVVRSFTSEDLLDVAIHEVAHLRVGQGHTAEWASEELEIRRKLRPTYQKARRAVEAGLRGAGEEQA